MTERKGVLLLLLAVLFGVGWYASRPCLVVVADGRVLASVAAEKGLAFSTRFIHSVQKTPVEEYFTVNDTIDGFVLHSTRYQSFGVGLPFLATDGSFRRDGDWFVMDAMERKIPVLTLRPGVSTELTLRLINEEIPLYEMVPPGTAVTLRMVPRYALIKGRILRMGRGNTG